MTASRPREFNLMEPTPEMRQHMNLDKRLDAIERRLAKLEERLKEE